MMEHEAPMNCWEFKKCGREPGGAHVADLGVCPAATEMALDGANLGKASGRACWVVAGTFCEGVVQGTFAQKLQSCTECEFKEIVAREEYPRCAYTNELLKRLHDR
ncbi:MAG: hypothetical protein WC971_07755 [Coriobacteriia bacterium]